LLAEAPSLGCCVALPSSLSLAKYLQGQERNFQMKRQDPARQRCGLASGKLNEIGEPSVHASSVVGASPLRLTLL